MKSLSVIFLVFSIRCQTFFKPLENNQTYIWLSKGHEIIHLLFYHIDNLDFPEPNRDFQCGTNHIGGEMVTVVDSGFGLAQVKPKTYKIGISCFYVKHAAFKG